MSYQDFLKWFMHYHMTGKLTDDEVLFVLNVVSVMKNYTDKETFWDNEYKSVVMKYLVNSVEKREVNNI